MNLPSYLKRAGLITGPTSDVTRHSHFSMLKNILLGNHVRGEIKKGGKLYFQSFGTILHELFLLRKLESKHLKLKKKDLRTIDLMIQALYAHPVVVELMKKTVKEKTRVIKFRGLKKFSFTPDAVQSNKIGIDLKSTVCKNLAEFVSSAFKYGYFRQGVTYSDAHKPKLKEFFIIGIQKGKPFNVYIVYLGHYPSEVKYSKQELDFLVYYYKNYGNFIELEQIKKPEANNKRTKKARK